MKALNLTIVPINVGYRQSVPELYKEGVLI